MANGLSNQVRELAIREYVEPARKHGGAVIIPIGEIQNKLLQEGFPPNHMRQIYTSLESKRLFREPLGLVLETPTGQPVRVGTVLRFRAIEDRPNEAKRNRSALSSNQNGISEQRELRDETSEEWATRLVGKLSGLLKEEIASFGGAAAFMEWVRSDHDAEGSK